MPNDQQLNSLAILAHNGCRESMWEIKSKFLKFIHTLSDSCRNDISSQSDFEEECFKIVEETVKSFDAASGDFAQLLVQNIKRRLGRSRTRFKQCKKRDKPGPMPIISDGEDGNEPFDIKDDLAIIDERLLLNEKITGLAAGDLRKLAILNSWLDPYYNDSTTAASLARSVGGKPESHRKFIGRFRTECQKALANAV